MEIIFNQDPLITHDRDALGSRQIGSLMLVAAHDAGAFQ